MYLDWDKPSKFVKIKDPCPNKETLPVIKNQNLRKKYETLETRCCVKTYSLLLLYIIFSEFKLQWNVDLMKEVRSQHNIQIYHRYYNADLGNIITIYNLSIVI